MRNTFTRNTGILRENEWTVIIGDYVHSEMPYIGAVDCDGDFVDITQVVPGISLEADEIIMNHDLFCDKEFVDDMVDYIAASKREVSFGPYRTKTYVLKLKENWRDLAIRFES